MATVGWQIVGNVPPIKAVMRPFPHCISPTATIGDARALMEQEAIHHLPVIDGDRLEGVVDYVDLAPRLPDSEPLEHVMSRDPYVVEMDQPLDLVLLALARQRSRSALVQRDDRIVGIFTATDACRLLGRRLATCAGRNPGNDAA